MKQLRITLLALLLPAFAFATPNNPSNLTLTHVTSHSVTLNWEDNSEDETGFKILVDGKYLLKTAQNITHFTVGSLSPNREYEFTVKSTDFNDEHHKATITTDKQTYNEYEDIAVHLKNLIRDDANNWVGIYPKDASNDWNNKIEWERPKEGNPNVTLHGIAAGEYEARLFYSSSFELLDKVGFSVGNDNLNRIYPPEVELKRKKVDRVDRPEKSLGYIDKSFDDAVTRTITRITNRKKEPKYMNDHPYPKHGSAWNSDMSLLRLEGRLYDARDKKLSEIPLTANRDYDYIYSELMERPRGTSGIRWSKHNPNVLYVMSNENNFFKLTINKEKTKISSQEIIDFNTLNIDIKEPYFVGKFTIGHNEGRIDYADRYVVLSASIYKKVEGEEPKLDENNIYAVLLDIKDGHLVGEAKKITTETEYDWITISPSGKYILVSSGDGVRLYNRDLEVLGVLANKSGHGDVGYDQNGNEMYVQLLSGGEGIFGYILKDNPNPEERIKLLDSNYGGGHVSCQNYKRKGWCYIGTNEKGYREVYALKLDGSKLVQRFAKTHASGIEYPEIGDDKHQYFYSSPLASPSPDGTKVLFWSDYGNPDKELVREQDDSGDWHYTGYLDYIDSYQVEITK